VLRHLRKARNAQGLRHNDGKAFDVMHCADGAEVWFGISAVLGSLSKQRKAKDAR